MIATPILALAATTRPEIPASAPRVTSAPDDAVISLAGSGSCEIRLLADRVPSLRAGSTHKVYRGWRFAVVMRHGQPRPGTTLFTVPVDPAQLAASRSRYALVQLATPGAPIAGDPAAFSWSAISIGTSDPFATSMAQVHRQLAAAGWMADAAVPTRYAKTEPTIAAGEVIAIPPASGAAHVAIPEPQPAFRTAGSEHLSMAAQRQEIAGLDTWESEGGTAHGSFRQAAGLPSGDAGER
jgi:hypothetical protein